MIPHVLYPLTSLHFLSSSKERFEYVEDIKDVKDDHQITDPHPHCLDKFVHKKIKWFWWIFWILSLMTLISTELLFGTGFLSIIIFESFHIPYSGDLHSHKSFFIIYLMISFVIGLIYFIMICAKACCARSKPSCYAFFVHPPLFILIILVLFSTGYSELTNFFKDHALNITKEESKCSASFKDFHRLRSFQQSFLDSCSRSFYVNNCTFIFKRTSDLLLCNDYYYFHCHYDLYSCCNSSSECFMCESQMSSEDVECLLKRILYIMYHNGRSISRSLFSTSCALFSIGVLINCIVACCFKKNKNADRPEI
jgi:hypothetical protein